MIYNIYFDIAALVNALVVFYAYAIHKKLPEAKNFTFLSFCLIMFATTIVDMISAYAISYCERFSISFLYIINCLFFICIDLLPLAFCLFTITFTDQLNFLKKFSSRLLVFLPFVIEFILIALTPVYNIVFSISEDHVYTWKSGLFILYGLCFLHVIIGTVIIIRADNFASKNSKKYFYSFVVVSVISIGVEFVFRNILIQCYGISVSLLLLLYSLQDTNVIISGTSGLMNQQAFNVMTSKSFAKKKDFCIISVYIDDLQFMTTTFGIEGMNSIMFQVSTFLKDISLDNKVFQLANDTFCVMIPNIEAKNYSYYSTAITDRFKETWKSEILEIKLNARLCVIRCPKDAETTEAIIEAIQTCIDDPRYRDEKLLFADKIDVNTKKRYAFVEQLVRTAIQERRIDVYYQPLYSISEDRIIGAEALVRMKDHEGNFISPDEFIPIAEQNGQILRIGLFVYEEVCRFISMCHLKNLGIRMIDVNLSVAQCMQARLCDDLELIMKSYNLTPDLINLEITETAVAHNTDLLYTTMKRLNEMGFSCSLDDYGMGYANINYILNMAFSMIKIDKGIVWNAMEDERANIILVGIIDMIHKLDMKIVAEGVETKEMVEKLSGLNSDLLQGYYYSRPVPEKEFLELIRKQAEEKGIINKTNYIQTKDDIEDLTDVEELEELEDIDDSEGINS